MFCIVCLLVIVFSLAVVVVVIISVSNVVDGSVFSHKILFVISQIAFSQSPSSPMLNLIKTQGLGSR